jgi:LmbE family N-acetylglucosaminyl deacetylase
LLVLGAHPDDAELKAGGLAALYRRAGHAVRFVSMTDGSAGHHQMSGASLAARRRAEAESAAATLGIESEVWEHPDGRLEPTLERREQVIRAIRGYRPDLVLTHRPNDYHPDHRAVAQLVQDAAYLLTVPALCPDTRHLRRDPVIAYLSDEFTRPWAFEPTVIIDVADVWDDKIGQLHEHRSQFYEWLPYNGSYEDDVPAHDDDRRAWLSAHVAVQSERLALRFSAWMQRRYGYASGRIPRRIEAFEASEYGAPLDDEALARLFPFAPRRVR